MNQEKIGELIKKIRKDNNLTQKDLADKLGVTYQAVSKWENGKNIPDIAILKQISNEYNINLDDLLNGEEISKISKKYVLIGGISLFILMIITILILLIGNKTDLFLRKITTYDNNFEITGTVAKSNGTTYIYISDITYKDESDEIIYDSIKATLYEEYKGKNTKINECDLNNQVTLKEYFSKITINIDDYKSDCKDIAKSKLYLEIETISNNKTTYYKIPLELEDICPDK